MTGRTRRAKRPYICAVRVWLLAPGVRVWPPRTRGGNATKFGGVYVGSLCFVLDNTVLRM